MFKKKQLIVIVLLPLGFSACTKNTYSITVPGSKVPYHIITTEGKDGVNVNTGIVYTVTNF